MHTPHPLACAEPHCMRTVPSFSHRDRFKKQDTFKALLARQPSYNRLTQCYWLYSSRFYTSLPGLAIEFYRLDGALGRKINATKCTLQLKERRVHKIGRWRCCQFGFCKVFAGLWRGSAEKLETLQIEMGVMQTFWKLCAEVAIRE